MPVSISNDPSGKGYKVSTPNGVKGEKMTLRNATRQARLLKATDYGWKSGKKGKK